MVAFTYRMPAGIPGEVNRIESATIEAAVITPYGTTVAPTAHGVPLVVDATAGNVGNLRTLQAADTTVYGVLARAFPAASSQDALGTSTPPANGPVSVLKRGYMSVLLSGSTAATKGAPAYVWTAAATGSHIVGGWEVSYTSGSTIAVANSYFTGPADSNNITELAFNI